MLRCTYPQWGRGNDQLSLVSLKVIHRKIIQRIPTVPLNPRLQLANASVALDTSSNLTRRRSLDALICKAAQEVRRATAPVTTVSQLVDLASPSERAAASLSVVHDSIQEVDTVLDRLRDRFEDVALSEHSAVLFGCDGKRVAGVVVPVVVDGVQKSAFVCAADLGAAAGGVMDVVALEGDGVVGADEKESPVVVIVAAGRPAGVAVNLGIRNGDALAGVIACDDVLTADERGLDVVDPDQIGACKGDGIAAPDVLRV